MNDFFCAILSFWDIIDLVFFFCGKIQKIVFVGAKPSKSRRKKYEIDHISKNKHRTKRVIHAKNERQINSNLPCKFGHFWRKLNFRGKVEICAKPIIFFSIAHLLCRYGHFWGCLHTRSWETTLFALVTAQRAQIIHAVNIRNIRIGNNLVVIPMTTLIKRSKWK